MTFFFSHTKAGFRAAIAIVLSASEHLDLIFFPLHTFAANYNYIPPWEVGATASWHLGNPLQQRLPHRAQKNSAGQNSAKAAAFLAEQRPVVGKPQLAQDVVVKRGAEGEGARGAGDADVGGLGGEDPEGDRQGGRWLQGEGGGWRAERGWRVEAASSRQPHTGQ